MKTQQSYIIGITGGSGSGKTLFLKKLLENFKEDQICLISQDNYYHPRTQQPKDENGVSNFDTTQSIDFKAYAKDISILREGKKVVRKEYTFNNPNLEPRLLEFNPAPVIVVEGIFVLYYREIADLLDLKVFIDAKDHIRLKRRIIRDSEERGYDLDDVLYRYDRHVIPTYEKYIEPYKQESDLIIPNNSEFNNALTILVAFLKTKVPD
jgi:uridine kinase